MLPTTELMCMETPPNRESITAEQVRELLGNLGITQKEIDHANQIVAPLGVIEFSSTEPQYIFLNRIHTGSSYQEYKPQTTWRIDPITNIDNMYPFDTLAEFLPSDLRTIFRENGLISPSWGTKDTSPKGEDEDEDLHNQNARKAKNMVLGMLAGGMEFQAQDFRSSRDNKGWRTAVEFLVRLHQESQIPFRISMHNPFLWAKNTIESPDEFGHLIIQEIGPNFFSDMAAKFPEKTGEQIQGLMTIASTILYKTLREYPQESGNFNFETMFPSGYLDVKIREQIDKLPKEILEDFSQDEILKFLAEVGVMVTLNSWKTQVREMYENYGVKRFTFHGAPIGAELTDKEFIQLRDSLIEYATFAREKGILVQLETQGLSKEQYEGLFGDPRLEELRGKPGETGGWSITLDVSHMDIEEAQNPHLSPKQQKPTQNYWAQKIKEGWVTEVHLISKPESVSEDKGAIKDTHWGISSDIGGATAKIENGEITQSVDTFVPGVTSILGTEDTGPSDRIFEAIAEQNSKNREAIILVQESNPGIEHLAYLRGLFDSLPS